MYIGHRTSTTSEPSGTSANRHKQFADVGKKINVTNYNVVFIQMTRLLPRLDLQNAFVIVCVRAKLQNGLHCAFNIQLHQSEIKHNKQTLWNKIMSEFNSVNN